MVHHCIGWLMEKGEKAGDCPAGLAPVEFCNSKILWTEDSFKYVRMFETLDVHLEPV